MEQTELQRRLEAILFAAGEPVEISRLSTSLEIDKKDIIEAADALANELAFARRGIRIIRLDKSYQMVSSGEMVELMSSTFTPSLFKMNRFYKST